MTQIIFYPIGNADCTLIHFADDRLLLKDYACIEADDNRVQLDDELRSFLKKQDRSDFDIVAFSHADQDHVQGSDEFFWFDYATDYQGDDRIKIQELHVPANFILEANLKGAARVIRQEARHRLKEGYGIRVYGEPDSLSAFLESADIAPEDRAHLISRAGQFIPDFTESDGAAEIFIHSPFTFRVDEDETERNDNSLVWHITFFEDDQIYRMILGADAEHQAWADIVSLSKYHGNEERLVYNLFRISHHCSYTALAEDKGNKQTEPREEVDELFQMGQENCILVSSSQPIPDEDTDQPPHRQAAAYYINIAEEKGDKSNFFVTMQWPTKEKPKPLIVDLNENGFTPQKSGAIIGGVAAVTRNPSPRVGLDE